MIPQKTITQQIHQPHPGHDSIVVAIPFAALLLPLLLGICITQHTKHKKQVLKQRIEMLERLWNKTTDKKYS